MSEHQVIHLYTLCWNDARMLPFFFRHYDSLVDHYFIYDNGSTDASLQLLDRPGKVSVGHFEVSGDSFVEEERALSDSIWKQSRSLADWVIVIDIDEHVFNPDMANYLRSCTERGITAIRGIGYEMVSDHFPSEDEVLVNRIVMGTRSAGHDKLCIFDPSAIEESRFGPGRHKAEPEGRVIFPKRREVLLLHYKQLGVEYTIRRSAELRAGLGTGDMDQQWGIQYRWSPAEIAERWSKLRASAGPIPGLGTLRDIATALYDDEYVVAQSGLLDAQWYLANYPDVDAAAADAVSHFCIHGWREDRLPNFYFQPAWYLDQHPEVRASGRNPLVHYIVSGEQAGARPSPRFEPGWYREHYGLDPETSPLQHYIMHRATGKFSPLPSFDVEHYVRENPRHMDAPSDPFEVFIRESQTANAPRNIPSYREVVDALGIDLTNPHESATADPFAVLQVLTRFLELVAVDEEWYRLIYPDVAAAIDEGAVASAKEHFVHFGYFEGRSPFPHDSRAQAEGGGGDNGKRTASTM